MNPSLSEESKRTHTRNLSEESFPANFMEYQMNAIPSYYSEPPFFNQNAQNANSQNRNYYSHHQHQHNKSHHYSHNNLEKNNVEALENTPNFFPETNQNPSNSFIANNMGTPSHGKNSKKSHKNSKRKDKRYGEKEQLQLLLNNEKMQAHSNYALISQHNKEKIENNVNGLSHNISYPPNNFKKAGPGSFSQQQQMYNMMPLDKDLSNSGRRCNLPPPPQIYQPPPLRANGYFYGNNAGNNSFMNGNMSQTNLYCYPGNNNPFIGVNYPNVQNIAFAKPNNYSSFAVVDIGPESNNPQFGINYLSDRSYTDKVRNNNEYWKPPYYPYNNQS